ncbi:MAG: hypothetical protein HC787_08570 [Nostocaceae cyanobacterium CSU_2_110]|nr:hypothetical protein [Richelia sp. SM1_7_0]NJS16880.1 hypothetical protein [Nostocaceae cyanobacterium CSU_2_110]
MVNIQNQINNVIQKRREQLPLIEAHIQQVRDVEKALNELNSALANLVNHPKATDQLRVRPPRHLCPKGADGLLISICRQIVSLEKDKKRVFFSRIWRWFTDEDEKLKKAIETLQAKNFGTRVKHL